MSVSQQDIESLEEWLDGELSPEQVDALRTRLSADPQLAETVDRFRGDRQFRCQLFASLEPNEAEIERLTSFVRREVRKQDLWNLRLHALSRVSGIAAAIAVVFFAGWISRSRLQVGGTQTPVLATNAPINRPENPGMQPGPRNGQTYVFVTPMNVPNVNTFGRNNTPVNFTLSQPGDIRGLSNIAPNYRVQVLDPITGGAIYNREFEELDDAKQFADYAARYPSMQDVNRLRDPSLSPAVVPVNDEHIGK